MEFDAIQANGNVLMRIMAGGLKISLLTTLFRAFTLLFASLGIIILVLMKKEKKD